MSIKLLYLDTCSVVKIFLNEKGHDVMMWLLGSESVLAYSVYLLTSSYVLEEFPRVIGSMETGRISPSQAKGILQRYKARLRGMSRLHVCDRGKSSSFRDSIAVSADVLLAKHQRNARHKMDMLHLAVVKKCLGMYVAGSLPNIVTSDRQFKSVIRKEGLGIIDPEEIGVVNLKQYLGQLDGLGAS